MGSIQLGIQHAVGGLASKPERDLLMQDFMTVETTNFPSEGSNHTPAHHFSEFKFKNYAPIAFRYFRDLFGIQPDDFLVREIKGRGEGEDGKEKERLSQPVVQRMLHALYCRVVPGLLCANGGIFPRLR